MITYDETLDALLALPENGSNGEWCAYGADDLDTATIVPVCAVGHVLATLAPDAFRRAARERNESNVGELSAIGILSAFDPQAIDLLGAVQNHADNGATWGESLQLAVAEFAD